MASTGKRKKDISVFLDGNSLTIDQLMSLEVEDSHVDLTPEAWKRVTDGRGVIDNLISSGKKVYGINTGFGSFSNVGISTEKLRELQENLIRSHAAGVGELLSPARTRRLLTLRINVLAKGRSGISPDTLRQLVDACNKWCLSAVPVKGTVGASGDLAPLAHLALGLMGEGKMWNPQTRTWADAKDVLAAHGLRPLVLGAKEGLALINGTQFIVTFGAEALHRAANVAVVADVAAALSLEALKGTVVAFDEAIHRERAHSGQQFVAKRLRSLLHTADNPSEIAVSHKDCGVVQDSYTLRCVPQVHGICLDTIEWTKQIVSTEMNSATDNPMVFAEDKKVISGGNFHGEYPAKAMDYLAIGVHEYANISERRIERLVNTTLNGTSLPPFLVSEGGLNSGFMIAHCTAAALVSEDKALCHPASVDSISTSAAKEDHVSMGGWAARKAVEVVSNVETVLAIELLAACQAIEFMRPLKSTPVLESVHALVREVAAPWDTDRFMAPDINAVVDLVRSGKIAQLVNTHMRISPEPLDEMDDFCGGVKVQLGDAETS
eukprot:TRINITY_DN12029_c0_g1_i1.p1 TRINITY_DN12029_c0_g1~~TRINITY_DN12029_c0_g1_i1.p1  ORF type:complete len:550 (-),score=174.83 TRINITY_DN12029_c0_g1_i1:175-1824(-)